MEMQNYQGEIMKIENFKEKSYWLTTRDYTPNPPLTEDLKVDVAIIDGGFIGLTTACNLKKAEPDMKIPLFETQVVGFEASDRTRGFTMLIQQKHKKISPCERNR